MTDINYDEWAAIGHANGWLGVRANDGTTSKAGAKSLRVRAGSQRAKLLVEYFRTHDLTDEEAGKMSNLASMPKCCYWKRCGELRQAGYITPTGETRTSSAGVEQQVCMITVEGMKAIVGLV